MIPFPTQGHPKLDTLREEIENKRIINVGRTSLWKTLKYIELKIKAI